MHYGYILILRMFTILPTSFIFVFGRLSTIQNVCSLVRTEFNKKYFDVLESLLVANNIQYFTNTYLKKHSLHIVTIYLTIAITIGSMSTFFNTIYNEFSSVRCEHLRIFLLLFCIIWVYIPCNTFNMSRLTLVKLGFMIVLTHITTMVYKNCLTLR